MTGILLLRINLVRFHPESSLYLDTSLASLSRRKKYVMRGCDLDVLSGVTACGVFGDHEGEISLYPGNPLREYKIFCSSIFLVINKDLTISRLLFNTELRKQYFIV